MSRSAQFRLNAAWRSGTAGSRPDEGIAQRVLAVWLQAGHPGAWPGQPDHLGQDLGGFGNVDQQGTGVYQVERARGQSGAPGICRHDVDVAQPALTGELPGHRDVGRVGVRAHDASAPRDPLGQQLDDPARPRSPGQSRSGPARGQPDPAARRCRIAAPRTCAAAGRFLPGRGPARRRRWRTAPPPLWSWIPACPSVPRHAPGPGV